MSEDDTDEIKDDITRSEESPQYSVPDPATKNTNDVNLQALILLSYETAFTTVKMPLIVGNVGNIDPRRSMKTDHLYIWQKILWSY